MGPSKPSWCTLFLPVLPQRSPCHMGWFHLPWVFHVLSFSPLPRCDTSNGPELIKPVSIIASWEGGQGEWKDDLEFSLEVETMKEATNMYWLVIFDTVLKNDWVTLKREKFEFSTLATFLDDMYWHSTRELPASDWTVRWYQHFLLLLHWQWPGIHLQWKKVWVYQCVQQRQTSLHGELWGISVSGD